MKYFLYHLYLVLTISLFMSACGKDGSLTKEASTMQNTLHKDGELENSAIDDENKKKEEENPSKESPKSDEPSNELIIGPKLSEILHLNSELNITKYGSIISLLPIDKKGVLYLLSEYEGLLKVSLQEDGTTQVLSQQRDYNYLQYILRVDESRVLISDGYDGLYLLRDDANLTPISHFHNNAFATVTLEREPFVYSAFGSQGVLVFSLAEDQLSQPIAKYDSQGYAQALALDSSNAQNQTTLFLGDGFDGVKILDVTDSSDIYRVNKIDCDGWVSDLVYASTQKRLYVASSEGGIEIDDVSDLDEPKSLVLYDFNETITSLALSSDESMLFVGSDEGSVWLYQTDANQTLKKRYHLHFGTKINDLIYQKRGQRLYISTDKGLFIYRLI